MNERKQIAFDLDTNVLKQIHGEKNYSMAGHFDYDGTPGKYAQKNTQHDAQNFSQTQKSSDNMDAKRRKAYLQYIAASCGTNMNDSAQPNATNTYTPP